jgi:hypothetical protein
MVEEQRAEAQQTLHELFSKHVLPSNCSHTLESRQSNELAGEETTSE